MAEAQWLQILWRDLVFGDVQKPDWFQSQAPFTVVRARCFFTWRVFLFYLRVFFFTWKPEIAVTP